MSLPWLVVAVQSREARHITHLKELGEAGGGYSVREYSVCRAARNNNVTTTSPKVIIGRARNYINHLAKCEHNGIATAEQLEQVSLQAQQEKWKVGVIITDSAGHRTLFIKKN
ncbi:uncharacterized protein PITG_17470 [Phytophthora infestans T30-4]|uniref:Uncharacterized protein n=1 Tax=Phytophthora infestans (strain T30-4) TaxID=403677 RepID=D0NW44_PHYIT|nr:uncharacterized protein PITG_17470 [Phytophthora infestans T30-4]EEY66886.1 hypothetical protein PITG_17470 [Phytophthora infestans T30-4]|eukprot:XP_002896695.1 hypothetical protein PITG_17470 [Phytophthora infestans T30-4]